MISRRTLLIDGAISVGFGRYAWSEEFAPVELEFPGVELDAELRRWLRGRTRRGIRLASCRCCRVTG